VAQQRGGSGPGAVIPYDLNVVFALYINVVILPQE